MGTIRAISVTKRVITTLKTNSGLLRIISVVVFLVDVFHMCCMWCVVVQMEQRVESVEHDKSVSAFTQGRSEYSLESNHSQHI